MTALRADPALAPMPSRLQRRLTVVAAVIGLHVAGVWALQSGLLRRALEVVIPVQVMADLIEPPQPEPPPPAPPAPPEPQKAVPRPPAPRPRPAPPPPAPLPVANTAPEPSPMVAAPPPEPAPAAPAPVAAAPAPAAPPAPPAPPQVIEPLFNADYLNNPKPAYPAMSRRLVEEGRVMLRVFVDTEGRPARVQVLRSSGYERLDRTAVDTVQRWRFAPGKRGGVAEAMWVNVPVDFKLNK